MAKRSTPPESDPSPDSSPELVEVIAQSPLAEQIGGEIVRAERGQKIKIPQDRVAALGDLVKAV